MICILKRKRVKNNQYHGADWLYLLILGPKKSKKKFSTIFFFWLRLNRTEVIILLNTITPKIVRYYMTGLSGNPIDSDLELQ